MKYSSAFFALIMAFLIAGCAGSGGIKEVNVHVGTEGLEFGFETGAPPAAAFEGDAIPITIKLMNKGAHDISNGYFTVSVEKALLQLEGDATESFTLNGRSRYDTRGGEVLVRKGAFVKTLDPMTEVISSTVSLTACYAYHTTGSANVCIDTDLFNQNPQKVCQASQVEFSKNGQGAPVGISRIEPKMRQHSDDRDKVVPQFLIYIKNMGDGQCIEPTKTQGACTGAAIPPEFWNTAVVKAYLLDQPLDCTPKIDPDSAGPEGHIKFSRDGSREDYIRCELKEGISKSMGTYTSTLKVDVDYGYTKTVSESIQIKKV